MSRQSRTKGALPVLRKMLSDVFEPPQGHAEPMTPAEHYQVYTESSGTKFRLTPAYCGNDKAEAERVALEVSGRVSVVGWRWTDPDEYAPGVSKKPN